MNSAEKRLNALGPKKESTEETVEIEIVLDASGSMGTLKKETIENYNKFLREQKAQPGKANITLTTFGSTSRQVYSKMPLSEAPELTDSTYHIDGWTALYDTLGEVFNRLTLQNPKYAIIVVITDGEENYSTRHNKYSVGAQISGAQNRGWRVVYLGANQDAFKESSAIGINHLYAQNFAASAKGLQNASAFASLNTTSYRDSAKSTG